MGSFFWRDSRVRLDFKYILIGWLLFFGLNGVGQWLKGGTLGLFWRKRILRLRLGFGPMRVTFDADIGNNGTPHLFRAGYQ